MPKSKKSVRAVAEASVTPPDTLSPNHSLARVVRAEGNSLFALELPDKTTFSGELPDRLRNTVWIRRGGYVVVERWEAGGDKEQSGRNVGGEIVNVVRDEKEWRKQPYWPTEFAKNTHGAEDEEEDESRAGRLPPSDSEGEDGEA